VSVIHSTNLRRKAQAVNLCVPMRVGE